MVSTNYSPFCYIYCMRINKIRFKNFKSYGNNITEINFDDKSCLGLIVGENGSGKSCIGNVITYALYGKLDDATASEIPNRINKNFYCSIDLDCGKDHIFIERGLSPKLFNVKINDETVDDAGKLNVQSMLEDNYYHIPYSVFKNLIVLSINDFKSLVDLNPSEKRNIVDKIFGFSILNDILKMVKEDARQLQLNSEANTAELRSIISSIEHTKEKIVEKDVVDHTEEIKELEKEIEDYELKKNKLQDTLKKLTESRIELNNKINTNTFDIRTLQSKIADIDKRIKLIDGGKCPTCGSDLHGDDFIKEREDLIEQKDDYLKRIDAIKTASNNVSESISKTNENYSKADSFLKNIGSIVINKKEKILVLKNDKPVDNTSWYELINEFKKKKEELDKKEKKFTEQIDLYNKLNFIFGENGAKQYVNNSIVPQLNAIIADIVNFMSIPYTIRFDNMFNTTITNYGVSVSYRSLSSGERKRVDFACIIAFIRLMKIQYPSMNLLFLDEIMNSLDINGASTLMEILKGITNDLNVNAFVIHHAQLDANMFDKIIKVQKINGFSQIEIE